MAKPLTVTFYSFRGGVGRSLAMLNVGWVLARTGSRVLLVDFDLEAPGLTQLVRRQDLVAGPAPSGLGVVDLVHEFLTRRTEQGAEAKAPLALDLSPHLVALKVPEPALPAIPCGSLHLIPAGRQADYPERLQETRSRDFTARCEEFAKALRAAFAAHPAAFDYVLVDARTGLSDEAYLACHHLCDRLVLLTALNDQNVAGTAFFLENAATWRAHHEGPEEILLVASPVPEYEDEPKAKRLKEAEERLQQSGGPDLRFRVLLPYHPRLALDTELIASLWPESGLARAYVILAEYVRQMAEDRFGHWARRASEAMDRRDAEGAVAAFRRLAALDYDQATRLMRQAARPRPRSEDRAKALLSVLPALAEVDPAEPLYPLQEARIARSLRSHEEAVLRPLKRAEAIARRNGSRRALAAILLDRARYLETINYSTACDDALAAAALFQELEDLESEGDALLLAGRANRSAGAYPAARKQVSEAIELAGRLAGHSAQRLRSAALYETALLERLQGRYDDARHGCEEALAIDRELGDRRGISATLRTLGEIDRFQGLYDNARREFEEALAIARKLGHRQGIGATLHSLAGLDCLQGRYDAARRGSEEALAIARELGYRQGICASLLSLAELDCLQGRYDAARRGSEEALAVARELGHRQGISATLDSLAELDRLHGRYDAARRGFEEALTIDRELGDRREIAVSELYLETARAQESAASGLAQLRAAAAAARECPDPLVAAIGYQRVGEVLRQRERLAEAIGELGAGIEFAQAHGFLGLVAEMQAERALAAADASEPALATPDAAAAIAFFDAQQVAHPQLARLRELAAGSAPAHA